MPAFAVRDATKSYGDRAALAGVSLIVEAGEMVALIGASGSGKSTLLRSLIGLVRLDPGGEVEAFGASVQSGGRLSDGVRAVRAKVGFIFQQFNLISRLSLFANVMIGALGRVHGWRGLVGAWPAEDQRLGMAALARVGIADRAGQRASTLSGGQQQRAAIARALVQGAQGVLADEPVASLDPVSARRVLELLQTLNREDGLTVVVSLHHVDYALRYCPRIVALAGGKVVYDGPAAGVDRKLLVDSYGPEYDAAGAEPDAR